MSLFNFEKTEEVGAPWVLRCCCWVLPLHCCPAVQCCCCCGGGSLLPGLFGLPLFDLRCLVHHCCDSQDTEFQMVDKPVVKKPMGGPPRRMQQGGRGWGQPGRDGGRPEEPAGRGGRGGWGQQQSDRGGGAWQQGGRGGWGQQGGRGGWGGRGPMRPWDQPRQTYSSRCVCVWGGGIRGRATVWVGCRSMVEKSVRRSVRRSVLADGDAACLGAT